MPRIFLRFASLSASVGDEKSSVDVEAGHLPSLVHVWDIYQGYWNHSIWHFTSQQRVSAFKVFSIFGLFNSRKPCFKEQDGHSMTFWTFPIRKTMKNHEKPSWLVVWNHGIL